MLKMVDGTGIIGVDMICPLGVSTPQPPNYDRVELEGTGMLVLPNSLDAPLERLELGGKTEQVQTTGKNLFDEKLLLDFDSENYDKTQSGSGLYYYKFPVNGTVTASTKNANKNGEYLTVGIKPDGSDKTWLSHGSAAISKYKTLTPEDGNIYLGVNNSLERVKSMIQNTGGIIINEGSAAKPYEPYTGGKPSPSQEYQQEVKNTGKLNADTQKYEVGVKVTGKNLFDREKAKDVSNWISIEGDGYLKFPIRAKKGSMITFSYEEKLTEGKKFYLGIAKKETGSVIAWLHHDVILSVSNSKYTIVSEEGYVYLMCNKNAIQNFLDAIQTLQVEISQTQTEYEPYKEQTLTLTSDRPITKWDRLVEQGGQIGWLYKHRVVNDLSALVKDTEPIYGNDGGKYFSVSLQNASLNYDRSKIYSEVGVYGKDNKIHYIPQPMMANAIIHVSDTDTIMTAKEHMHYKVVYETVDSEFIPLSQDQQDAIRALKTYYPTTVITVDGGEVDPDIKVTYRKEI